MCVAARDSPPMPRHIYLGHPGQRPAALCVPAALPLAALVAARLDATVAALAAGVGAKPACAKPPPVKRVRL